jgi:putative transposon-encoded protein
MVLLKRENYPQELTEKIEETSKSLKAKFEVFGEEMIEKEVKQSGNSGRVYLPPEWVGKHVKIIRMD